MLWSSKQCNKTSHEVDVTTPAPLYKLVRRELLRTLMQRTGDGSAVSVRQLAHRTGVSRSTIGNLLTGDQEATDMETAHKIVSAIGVDVLVLFVPVGRTTPLALVRQAVPA